VALQRWPRQICRPIRERGLVNVGRNKAIDRVRRQIAFRGKQSELTHEMLLHAPVPDEPATPALDDDMLRLIFICCHPSFAAEVRVALNAAHGMRADHRPGRARLPASWKYVHGASVWSAPKQRSGLPAFPMKYLTRCVWEPRLRGVLAVIYLVFTEGYAAPPARI